ncbi:MAG TPA: hypothetical protein VNS57_10555 [Steroidobacteraceae bacterium]|nr:hypothetical protein [Steroidobacteraceae bacterium]
MTRTIHVAIALCAGALFTGVTTAAPTEEHAHARHGAGTALVSQLQLNQGQRWATDASLRESMAAIREAFDADHPRIHAGQQTDAQYQALAASVETQVNRIVAQCKLPPDADAQLHLLVGDLMQAVGLMRGADPQRSRHDGAALVHGALRAYPKYFDDPSWRAEAAMPNEEHAHH